MATRHHYSIPGASFLRPRGSVKKATPGSSNVQSSSRDTRQPSTTRAYHTQETAPKTISPSRPPSASGYRTQHSNVSANAFQASSNTRPTSGQRSAATPQASSSRTRLDVPDPRAYLAKMFNRKHTPVPAQEEEKHKSSHRQRRNSQIYPAAYAPAPAPQTQVPPGPSTSRTAYDSSTPARESDREDRTRQKPKEDRAMKEERERMRAEYAAYKAKVAEAERVQAAAKPERVDRPVPRSSRDDRKQQHEYDSDNARRRLQAQHLGLSSGQKQEARQSYYLHSAQLPTAPPVTPVPINNIQQQQTLVPQAAVHPSGVPVQASTSSQSTSVSHQAQPLHPAPAPKPLDPIKAPTSASTPTPVPPSTSAPPPKASFGQYQAPFDPFSQRQPRHSEIGPTAPSMLPPYQPFGPDDRNRLEKEAAEREARLSREREKEQDKERELQKRRKAEKEAAEREALAIREREHELELERRHEAEKEAIERELQQHRERERERELDREKRRARRAERERLKELERAEQDRQDRTERERLRTLQKIELEKQKEAERTYREKKERERADRERMKAEREKIRDAERMERDRARERSERERDRATRAASRHRSQHDKNYSLPNNNFTGVASGSDTDGMNKKDGRTRSQSNPSGRAFEAQPFPPPPGMQRPGSRGDNAHAPFAVGLQSSVSKPSNNIVHRDSVQVDSKHSMLSPTSPVQPDHTMRHDQTNQPRSISAIPFSMRGQDLLSPKMPERSHTDPLLPDDLRAVTGARPSVPPPQAFHEVSESKLVSIYASQGPPDRTPYRATQKMPLGQPTTEQRTLAATSVSPSPRPAHEGRPRSSLDQSFFEGSGTVAKASVPFMARAISTQASRTQVQDEPSAVGQTSSVALTRDFIPSTQSHANSSASNSPVTNSASRPEGGSVLPEHILPSSDVDVQPSPAQKAHQSNLSHAKPPADDWLYAHVKPAALLPRGTGVSSYSQTVTATAKETSRAPALDQPLGAMSRVPSNNSTRSPSRRASQLPPEIPIGASSVMPVSRTASDASQSAETEDRRQSINPHAQTRKQHITSSHAEQQPLQPSTPLNSSTQNATFTIKVPHDAVTSLYQQSVFPRHTQSQSLPQQTSSSQPHDSSRADAGYSRNDNLSEGRSGQPFPVGNPDISQYLAMQKSSSQSRANYNSSTNAYLPGHSNQQSRVPSSSTTKDVNTSLRTSMYTNNLSTQPAAIANPTFSSHPSSNMFSHQARNLSNSSMYHNPPTSHNNVPLHSSQYQQETSNPTRPPLSQIDSNQIVNAAIKQSGPPTAPPKGPIYVTSTRPSGPFIEDSPSSAGNGLSLDSPPATRQSLQQILQSTDQPVPQPEYSRLQSVSAPPPTPVQDTSQTQTPVRTRKEMPAQDMDSPPPLTPSSSHESHEEILMTPASLDPARTQESSQRSEKRKSGLFGLFRSSSTKPAREKLEKNVKDRSEQRINEPRRQMPGRLRDQRSETVINKQRSTRPPSIAITAEPDSYPANPGSAPLNNPTRESRASKRPPPPITIPPQPIASRLFSSRSRRFRTMSSASMEAIDGTANNTVVGSPTSSRRSATPSGPLTPPIRDPIEAARTWRANEDVFIDRGSHRRRRPGVTFDLEGDEGQKDSALYRRKQRRDSPR